MIKIETSVTTPVVLEAIKLVNELLKSEAFYAEISQKTTPFVFSNKTPSEIAGLIRSTDATVTVTLYTARRRSDVYAYEDARYPGVVFLNTRKLNRSAASVAASIVHECVHSVDRMNDDSDFGHGGNSTRGKSNTAPYWIDELAERMLTSSQNKMLEKPVEARVLPLSYDLDPTASDLVPFT